MKIQQTQGNLALKTRRQPDWEPQVRRAHAELELITRRVQADETPSPAAVKNERKESVRRDLQRRRLRLLARVVLIVLSVSALFGFILYREGRVISANFANTNLRNRIIQLDQEVSQLQDNLQTQTNLDEIRHIASTQLGLQDPSSRQIRRVSLPPADRIIFASRVEDHVSENHALASLFSRVEGFFRNFGRTAAAGGQ